MTKVNVRLFARLADVVGARTVEMEIGEGLTAGDVFAVIAREHPGIAGLRVAFAVNQEYADADRALVEGDEVALIPPVSGGAAARRLNWARSGAVADPGLRSAPTFDPSVSANVDGDPSIPQDERRYVL